MKNRPAGRKPRTSPAPGAVAPASIKDLNPKWFDPANPACEEADLRGVTVDEDKTLLIFERQEIPVEWLFMDCQFREASGDTAFTCGLALGPDGTFYGVEIHGNGFGREEHQTLQRVIALNGKDAMKWLVFHASRDARFTREFCRAIDNPEFEFMSLVPVTSKARRKGAKKSLAGQFHEQLHMATALVETVRKLDADPSLENLADACRAVSAVHQELHKPDNFKAAAVA
jgi:hypothetical protein